MFRPAGPIALLLLALAGVSNAQPARNLSFLGSSATGRSVVIVIDRSAETSRSWRELCLQTTNTLRSLEPGQSFNVILTQGQDCLALSPDALLPAAPRNIDNASDTMRRWISRGRGNPIPALELAFRLKPEVIYLVASDNFTVPGNDEVARFCADRTRAGVPKIHTIALLEFDPDEARPDPSLVQSLQTIARNSGGQFGLATDANLRAETPPDHTLVIRRRTPVNVVGFAPDNKTAYVDGAVNQVNVWETIVHYWPEIAAAGLGVILLPMLIRAARKRHEPGEQYCRHCDYNLRGLTSLQCPECGTELTAKNRVPGRSRRPRLVVASFLLASVAATYVFAATRLPRQGSASQWIEWRSVSLANWAIAGKRPWLLRHTTLDDGIFRVDLDSGAIIGSQCRIQYGPDDRSYRPLLSADGRNLLCSSGDHAVQIDFATGKIVHRYGAPISWDSRIGTEMFFARSKGLAAWNTRTGEQVNTAALDNRSTIGGIVRAAGHDQAVVLSADDSSTTVRVWDPLTGAFTRTFRVESPSCCCDGGRLYAALHGDTDLTIETWDVLTGQRQSSTPTGQTLSGHLMLTARNDWIAATSLGTETLAVNLRTGAHRSWEMRYPRPTISPDGRHLIAGYYCSYGRYDEVRIHDLPQDP
ncbi:MAG: hypothetical protein ACHRHE_08640 [Tepidisphaerales bacterium]